MMTADNATPDLQVRHRPVQQRGQVRFDAILSAARDLLAEGGLEGFTIDDVAARAGIPVGSVYQFFPNKFAIVAELDSMDTAALIDDLAASAERFTLGDWQSETNALIDLVAAHWVDDPTRRAVWLAMRSTAATRSLAAEHSRALVTTLLPMIQLLTAGRTLDEQVTICEVVVEMSQSLLHFSVSDGKPNPATVRELKRMLRAYLRAVARIT
jgi:AcrR family transcriptional regulator